MPCLDNGAILDSISFLFDVVDVFYVFLGDVGTHRCEPHLQLQSAAFQGDHALLEVPWGAGISGCVLESGRQYPMLYAFWIFRHVAMEKYGPLVSGSISVPLFESTDRVGTVLYEGGQLWCGRPAFEYHRRYFGIYLL